MYSASVWGYSYRPDRPGRPFEVKLDASAEQLAVKLHRRFGEAVQLTVGALSYPDATARPFRLPPRLPFPTVDELLDFRCELDGPLTVPSGKTVSHGVLLTASTHRPMSVYTNGGLGASVVDPTNGRIVGGGVGASDMPLVPYPLRYRQPVRIPLGVGTASFEPDLGYTVPPGQWALTADIQLSDGRTLSMPPLRFEITQG